jgi:hypothetical protein
VETTAPVKKKMHFVSPRVGQLFCLKKEALHPRL